MSRYYSPADAQKDEEFRKTKQLIDELGGEARFIHLLRTDRKKCESMAQLHGVSMLSSEIRRLEERAKKEEAFSRAETQGRCGVCGSVKVLVRGTRGVNFPEGFEELRCPVCNS